MIKITLPDGTIKQVERELQPMDIAIDISEGLTKCIIRFC